MPTLKELQNECKRVGLKDYSSKAMMQERIDLEVRWRRDLEAEIVEEQVIEQAVEEVVEKEDGFLNISIKSSRDEEEETENEDEESDWDR